jgi:uncharacterized protein (DUF736 family)
MNVGTVAAVAAGKYRGEIQHHDLFTEIALAAVDSDNDKAPAFDVIVRSPRSKKWYVIGALWRQRAKATGEDFFAGQIKDPSLPAEMIELAFFPQAEGTMNISTDEKRPSLAAEAGNDDDPFTVERTGTQDFEAA